MPKNLKTFFLFLGSFLILANLLVLDWWAIRNWEEKREIGQEEGSEIGTQESGLAFGNKIATDSCGIVCQKTIEEKIKEELAKVSLTAGGSSVSPSVPKTAAQPTSVQSKIVYIPLITNGAVASITWTDVIPSEFYFDLNNYQGAKEVRFEAYLLSLNNDIVYARLYDVTNKRGVDFSDLQTNNSTFTRVESIGMKIWQGNNKYTVQLRSVNGTQAQLKDAKLKIIF